MISPGCHPIKSKQNNSYTQLTNVILPVGAQDQKTLMCVDSSVVKVTWKMWSIIRYTLFIIHPLALSAYQGVARGLEVIPAVIGREALLLFWWRLFTSPLVRPQANTSWTGPFTEQRDQTHISPPWKVPCHCSDIPLVWRPNSQKNGPLARCAENKFPLLRRPIYPKIHTFPAVNPTPFVSMMKMWHWRHEPDFINQ